VTHYEPVGLLSGALADTARAAEQALPLAGGVLAFTAVAAHRRGAAPRLERLDALDPATRAVLTAPRLPWAGLTLDRPRLMGVVNVTPDSFSDGGAHLDPGAAIAHGQQLAAAGAEIIDVGGESTRPGAAPTDADEELRRVLPVVRGLSDAGLLVSIDSRRARVMEAAIDAGARILNDVSALTGPGNLDVAVRAKLPVVLMHMRGAPDTMQQAARYDDVLLDVHDYLAARIAACAGAGIPVERIAVDPGLGFAKTAQHNLTLLNHLGLLHGLGCALLVGASRKSFIGRLTGGAPADDRLGGSLAAALAGIARGAQLVRVHDVRETAQALALWQAIARG
jgi:dihydropteroate synthase